jgi:hypothetical protein
VRVSPDGRFILSTAKSGRSWIWALPPARTGAAPNWLLELAAIYAPADVSKKTGPDNETPPAAPSFEAIRAIVLTLPEQDPYAEWGKWFFAAPDKRPPAPGFHFSVAEAQARGLGAPSNEAAAAEGTPLN